MNRQKFTDKIALGVSIYIIYIYLYQKWTLKKLEANELKNNYRFEIHIQMQN